MFFSRLFLIAVKTLVHISASAATHLNNGQTTAATATAAEAAAVYVHTSIRRSILYLLVN